MKKIIFYLMLFCFLFMQMGCKDSEKSQIPSIETDKENEEIIELLSIQDYFATESTPLDFDSDHYPEELSMLDSKLEGKEIFLTGEVHGIASNSVLELDFFKYFKEKTDFKYYLCESSYSSSYFINQYLETGNKMYLDEVYSRTSGNYQESQENYDFWLAVYEYNNALNEDQKINVVGVDIEHDYITSFRFLTTILPDKEIPDEIKASIDLVLETKELLESSFRNDYKAPKNSKIILEDFDVNRKVYIDYLGEEFIYFELVLQNVLNGKEAYKHNGDMTTWNNVRDAMIYENFVKLDNFLPNGKYFGQWGLAHVYQHKDKDIMWFGAYLNSEGSKYQDKVFSIAFNYLNCETMDKAGGASSPINFAFPFAIGSQDRYDENYILYTVNNPDLNRARIPMIHVYTGEFLEEDIKEFFQYLVLIKNSGPSQSLN